MDRMYIVLGDWSDDGHSEKVLIESNKTVSEIQDAYRSSCNLFSFKLSSGSLWSF